MDSRLEKTQRHLIAALVFFVVLAIFPLTPDPASDIKILGYELGAFAALALWLFTPRHAKEVGCRSSALLPLFFAYIALNLAATFLSPNMGYSLFREFTKVASLFILFVAAADVFRTPKHVWGLIAVLCIAVSMASLYGFVQVMGKDPFPWNDTTGMLRRAPATFGNRNFASHVLVPTVILAGGLCTRRKGRWALLCIALFLGHLALTRTRGSLLALATASMLVLVALIVFQKVKEPARAIAITLATLLLTGLIGIAALAAITAAKTGQPYPYGKGESIRLRYHSFYGACRIIQDRPWLGHGPGMYQVVNPEYWTPLEKDRFSSLRKVDDHVHNEPLEIAADAGLPAAIVYMAILLLGLYYGLALAFISGNPERRALGMALAAFFLAFLVDGLFGFNAHLPASAVILFLFAGATAGLWRERQTPSVRRAIKYRGRPLLWRLGALGCASVIPILGVREFSAQFCQQRGLAAMQYKAYDAAAASFRRAASLTPYNWLPPYYLGVVAMQTDRPDTAATYFARTLELNPDYLDAQFRIAETMFNLAARPSEAAESQDLERVVEYARRAAQLNPLSPEVHDLLGRAAFLRAQRLTDSGNAGPLQNSGQAWREAEQHLLHAIEYGSRRKDELYRLIAAARLARGDALGAQEALVRSIEEKPGEMATWQLFLQVSQKTGQYDAMRTSLERSIEVLNGSPNAAEQVAPLYLLRAKVLAAYGDESGAEDALLRVTEKYPARVDTWAAFHAFAKSTGREDAFKTCLLQALARQENEQPPLPAQVRAVGLGLSPGEDNVVAGVQGLADALQHHLATTKAPEGTADLFSWAADVLATQAQQAALSPKNAGSVFLNLGLVYGACQNFEAAAQWLDQAAPHLSGEQLLLCLLRKGAALSKIGKTGEAVLAYEQAAEIAPNSFEARYAFANALVEDGQRARARMEYLAIRTSFQVNEEARKTIQQELDALSK